MTQVDAEGTKLEVETTFCYVGDMVCSGHLSPKMRGKMDTACVCMVKHKTWGPNTSDLKQLHRNDRTVIHWIYGTKDRNEACWVSLLQKLGIKDITAVLHRG